MDVRGRGMPRLGWRFWVLDCRSEVLKFFYCFDLSLMIQKLSFKPQPRPGGMEREESPLPPSLAKLNACFYSALCTLNPTTQSFGSSVLAIL